MSSIYDKEQYKAKGFWQGLWRAITLPNVSLYARRYTKAKRRLVKEIYRETDWTQECPWCHQLAQMVDGVEWRPVLDGHGNPVEVHSRDAEVMSCGNCLGESVWLSRTIFVETSNGPLSTATPNTAMQALVAQQRRPVLNEEALRDALIPQGEIDEAAQIFRDGGFVSGGRPLGSTSVPGGGLTIPTVTMRLDEDSTINIQDLMQQMLEERQDIARRGPPTVRQVTQTVYGHIYEYEDGTYTYETEEWSANVPGEYQRNVLIYLPIDEAFYEARQHSRIAHGEDGEPAPRAETEKAAPAEPVQRRRQITD